MKASSKVRAFSLIELSIVVLIIGILIAGVTQSSRILGLTKLSTARTLTKSSAVSSVKSLSLWIDSTSVESFDDAETEDGSVISTWYDISPQTGTKANFSQTSTARPLYKLNIINGLPAVLFDGTNDFMTSVNFPNISTSSTVFMVVKLPSVLAAKPIFSKRSSAGYASSRTNIQVSTTATAGAAWQYCDDIDGATSQSSATACNYASTNTPDVAVNSPYVVSIVYSSNSADGSGTTAATGINFFQNGVGSGSAATTSNTPNTSVTASLFLGKDGTTSPAFFNSYISELIIFDRALKKEERQSIEAYLGKKWGIAMTTASY